MAAPNNRHLTFDKVASGRVLRATRTKAALDELKEVDAMAEVARRWLDDAGRLDAVLLVDLKNASLREESDYELSMRKVRSALTRGVHRVAFVVETRVGMIQVQRFLREEGIDARVFLDEQAAIRFLDGINR